jgi:hypothetical protein
MITNILTYYPKLLFLYYKFLVKISKPTSSSHSIVDETNPMTWEFSSFSQNSEDGIIEFLINKAKSSNKYFVEIGSSNGVENNTTYLAVVRRFTGIMIDGDKIASSLSKHLINRFCLGVDCLNMFVKTETIDALKSKMTYKNPDVFSLDIDGNDYYLARTILEANIKPKIFVVEYNSCYGPNDEITIKYQENFDLFKSHESYLYYGVSIMAWKKLFKDFGYEFITVDSNGVNAFFVNKNDFETTFIENCKGLSFQENFYQLSKFKTGWEDQFKMIENENFEKF